jgi:HEAT repeat protein
MLKLMLTTLQRMGSPTATEYLLKALDTENLMVLNDVVATSLGFRDSALIDKYLQAMQGLMPVDDDSPKDEGKRQVFIALSSAFIGMSGYTVPYDARDRTKWLAAAKTWWKEAAETWK